MKFIRFGMPDIVVPVEQTKTLQRDRAARALFAATEMVNVNKFETEIGRTVPHDEVRRIRRALQHALPLAGAAALREALAR